MKLRNQSCQLILGHYTANTRKLHTDTSLRKFPSLGKKIPSLGTKIPSAWEKKSKPWNKQRWGWMKKEVNPLILHVRSYFIKRIKELALQGIIDGIAL